MNYSIVQFLKERSGHSCGYCKSNGNFSDGMWAHMLTVQDYQDLIDRGWRRSGTFCYKPHMSVTCCPAYTIKCDALNFKLTKSQKKILKRMRKFLIDGKRTDSEISADSSSVDEGQAEGNPDRIRLESVPDTIIVDIDMKDVDTSMTDECESNSTRMDSVNMASSVDGKVGPDSLQGSSQHALTSPVIQKKNPHKVQGRDLSRPLQKKAKLIRLKRREKKCQEGQQAVSKKTMPQGKSLEEFLNEPLPENSKHNLEVRLVNFTEPDDQNERLLSEELSVYRKYQVSIHNDPIEKCTARHFTRFLVQSPLKFRQDPSGPSVGYGSFHQQYWLDGELIAVGVIDILPSCVSSVYFFYDPEYSFLSLGTYSSLREVEFVRSLQSGAESLKYYYMGFYIHSCPKMRYKAKVGPSYLLCPEIYSWHHVESCVQKLDKNKYSRLNEDPDAVSRDSDIDVNKVLILSGNVSMDFSRYRRLSKKLSIDISEDVLYYAKLVGKRCSQRMLLYQ